MTTTHTPSPIDTPIGPLPCQHCISIAGQWDAQAEPARKVGGTNHPVVRKLRSLAYRARSNAQTHRTSGHSALWDRAE
jgi:hypothetical protein